MNQRRLSSKPAPGGDLAPAASRSRSRGALRFDDDSGAYHFETRDLRYRVVVGSGPVAEGLLAIDASVAFGPWVPILVEAGMLFRDATGVVHSPTQARSRLRVTEFRHSARGKVLVLRYTETADAKPLQRTVQVRLVGQSLHVEIKATRTEAQGNYCGVALAALCPGARAEYLIPYTSDPVYMLEPAGFACVYLDRFLSHASSAPRGTAFYRGSADGAIAPIDEHAYVTVSENPLEGLPDLARPRSPQCAQLEQRVLLDLWSEQSFVDDAQRLAVLRRYGLRHLVIAYRNWQQFGQGRRAPVHYPAHLERGRNEPLRGLIQEAGQAGALVALEEQYTTLSPQCSYWDERVVARLADGAMRPGRDDGYAIAVDHMHEFARLEGPQIERNLAPTAAYLTAHTAWGPEEGTHQIDLFHPQSMSRTFASAIRCELDLFAFFRDLYGGPVLGDGGDGPSRFDTCYAGFVDGVERGLDGGAEAPVIPDYELRVVRPLMFNYGVGRYSSFFRTGPGQAPAPRELDWDLYRATEIAFGHGGYLSTAGVKQEDPARWAPCGDLLQAVTEYYLLQPLQSQYATASVEEIQYHHLGSWLTLADAMRAGVDFVQAQLRIAYGNGLTIYVNRRARDEWQVRTENGVFLLPPSGWVAANPTQSFLAYSALVSGGRADVVRCPAYSFLSARSNVARRIEGITTDGAAAVVASALPGLSDYYLVGGRTLALDADVMKLSERGDASLVHLSDGELELTLMDSESGESLNVTVFYVSEPWQRARIGLVEWSDGQWRRAPNQVQHTKRGLQIARVKPGAVYRLSLPDD
jgi:hypothetical protein